MGDGQDMHGRHMASFVNAVRSRKLSDLNAEAEVGQVSAACCSWVTWDADRQRFVDEFPDAANQRGSRCRGFFGVSFAERDPNWNDGSVRGS